MDNRMIIATDTFHTIPFRKISRNHGCIWFTKWDRKGLNHQSKAKEDEKPFNQESDQIDLSLLCLLQSPAAKPACCACCHFLYLWNRIKIWKEKLQVKILKLRSKDFYDWHTRDLSVKRLEKLPPLHHLIASKNSS